MQFHFGSVWALPGTGVKVCWLSSAFVVGAIGFTGCGCASLFHFAERVLCASNNQEFPAHDWLQIGLAVALDSRRKRIGSQVDESGLLYSEYCFWSCAAWNLLSDLDDLIFVLAVS